MVPFNPPLSGTFNDKSTGARDGVDLLAPSASPPPNGRADLLDGYDDEYYLNQNIRLAHQVRFAVTTLPLRLPNLKFKQ